MMAPVGITTSSSLYERHFPLTGPIACTLRGTLTACVSGAGEVHVGGDGLVTARARLPRARARVDTHVRTRSHARTHARTPHTYMLVAGADCYPPYPRRAPRLRARHS